MSKKFIAQLKSIKNENGRLNPDRSWVLKNRVKLIEEIKSSAKIENAIAETKLNFVDKINDGLHIFVSNRVLSFARSSLAILLVGTVAVSGWIASVSASVNSLPGDALYGVKLAAEKTELIVATVIGSGEDEVTTILKHASSRVDEYQRSESTEQASEAIKSLKKKIESTQESLDQLNSKSPVEAVAVAKVVEKKTEEILDSLAENKTNEKPSQTVESTESNKVQLNKEVSEAEVLIQKAGIKAVEVLIEKVESDQVGTDVLSKEDVKETINRKLDKVAEGVSKLDVQVVATSEKASSTIAYIASGSATGTINAVIGTNASSTPAVVNQIGETEKKVIEVEQKMSEVNKKVEDTKVEVKNLIEQNNLTAALDKIVELNQVKVETKVEVVETTKVVAEVQKVFDKEAQQIVDQSKATGVASTTTNVAKDIVSTTTTQTPTGINTVSSTIKTN